MLLHACSTHTNNRQRICIRRPQFGIVNADKFGYERCLWAAYAFDELCMLVNVLTCTIWDW